MHVRKKIIPVKDTEKNREPIDFDWIYMIGMKLGFSYSEVQHLYWGKWNDMVEYWKEQHNFETKKMIYKTASDYKIADLDDL